MHEDPIQSVNVAKPISEILDPTPIQDNALSTPILEDRIHHVKELLADPVLSATLTTFINVGFRDSKSYDPSRWDVTGDRFSESSEFHEMLGPSGVIAVVYAGSAPVACAGAVAWSGDQAGFRRPRETGWEIKAVTVKVGEAKKGLASRAVKVMQEYLVKREREKMGPGEMGKLSLWIQTAECVNGEYWRRRGFRDDRVHEKPVGYWASRTGFRMLVLVKEVDV